MKKIRFSLRLLVLLMTVICAYLGARHFRERQVLDLCAGLRKDGYQFVTPVQDRDWFWQRKPIVAYENEHGGNLVYHTKDKITGSTLVKEVTEPKENERLKRLGVVVCSWE